MAAESSVGEQGVSRTGGTVSNLPRSSLANGDVFRALGLPENLIVGLDTTAVTTNKSLPGIRDIPPGIHFLWVQQLGGVSRCGYWFITGARGTVRIKEWDSRNEVLGEPTGQFEAQSQKERSESVYPVLQPYTLYAQKSQTPASSDNTHPDWARSPASIWNALTGAISAETLARITGQQNAAEYLVDSIDCAKDTRLGETLSTIGNSASNKLTFLFTQDFHDLQILDLGPTSTGVADTSARIQALLIRPSNPVTEQAILGELQFTFLTGSHLGNPACLEQWWNLVLKMVLRAHALAVSHPGLTKELLQTLHAQLFYNAHYIGSSSSAAAQAKDGGGDDGTAADGFGDDTPVFQYKPLYREKLRRLLVEYRKRLGGLLAGVEGSAAAELEAVSEVFGRLETWLWRCGWDLRGTDRTDRTGGSGVGEVDSEEDEDELPVVVELDDEGREVGLVSFRD